MSAESARAFHLADARKRRAEREALSHQCSYSYSEDAGTLPPDRCGLPAGHEGRHGVATPITDRTDASHGEFKAMLVRFGEADPDAYIKWGSDHDPDSAA